MTNLLLRLFVKNASDRENSQVRSAVGTLSGVVGICCNLLLFLGKLLVGTLAGSVSITADALNNLSDASGSIVTLIGFRIADKPADRDHPYGHARAEYLSGLGVAVLILVIGLELGKSSIQKIFHPEPLNFSPAIVVVLTASILVKLWMCLFNRDLAKRIDSSALQATAADSRNDCITTAGVLAAALAERFFRIPVDGWMGLGVALFILYSGWGLAGDTISPLLGERTDPELRQNILDYVKQQPLVLGYHDLMVHDYGPGSRFASLHVEMDHRLDPLLCHKVIDDIERECLRSHGVHMVIHYDPVIVDDPVRDALKERVAALLQAQDSRLCFHDFRMAQGKKHMNLIFDVPLPEDLRGREGAIRMAVEDTLNRQGAEQYHVQITFDTDDWEEEH